MNYTGFVKKLLNKNRPAAPVTTQTQPLHRRYHQKPKLWKRRHLYAFTLVKPSRSRLCKTRPAAQPPLGCRGKKTHPRAHEPPGGIWCFTATALRDHRRALLDCLPTPGFITRPANQLILYVKLFFQIMSKRPGKKPIKIELQIKTLCCKMAPIRSSVLSTYQLSECQEPI